MRSFKKIIISSIAFTVVSALLFTLMILPYSRSESEFYCDCKFRKELVGSIDTIFLGASQCVRGLIPEEADKILGCKSYNLGGSLLTWHAREALLLEEVDRNPVKTVYMDIAFDTLQRGNETGFEGNADVLLRLDGTAKRIKYFFKETPIDQYDDMLSIFSLHGFMYSKSKLLKAENSLDKKAKGYFPANEVDISISAEETDSLFNCENIEKDFDKENLTTLERIVDICKVRNIELVFIVIPLSDNKIWKIADWNIFVDKVKELSDKYSCRCYDFNLLKSRYNLLTDKESFSNATHLSDTGAKAFTKEFATIMSRLNNGANADSLFYSSYDEMKKDSPYMKQLSLL